MSWHYIFKRMWALNSQSHDKRNSTVEKGASHLCNHPKKKKVSVISKEKKKRREGGKQGIR